MNMAKVWARQGILNVTETTTMTGSSYVQLQKKCIDSRAGFCFVVVFTSDVSWWRLMFPDEEKKTRRKLFILDSIFYATLVLLSTLYQKNKRHAFSSL